MSRAWNDFYYLTGSAGAGLIGLLFVVVTLSSDTERSRVMQQGDHGVHDVVDIHEAQSRAWIVDRD